MLTPSKKKKAESPFYLSALKFSPIFPAHFTQSRNSGRSISHTGAFYFIEHNAPRTSMNIDSLKLCIMGVLRFFSIFLLRGFEDVRVVSGAF